MLKTTKLQDELVSGTQTTRNENETFFNPKVEKCVLDGIDEIQCLTVYPKTSINLHGHDDQWEVWLDISRKVAFICPKGAKHAHSNVSDKTSTLFAIKGHSNYSFSELADFFKSFGFEIILQVS